MELIKFLRSNQSIQIPKMSKQSAMVSINSGIGLGLFSTVHLGSTKLTTWNSLDTASYSNYIHDPHCLLSMASHTVQPLHLLGQFLAAEVKRHGDYWFMQQLGIKPSWLQDSESMFIRL